MARRHSILRAAARIVLLGVAALAAGFFLLVALYSVVDPVSTLMLARIVEGKPYQRIPVRLKDVSLAAVAAVVVSEDATFCVNDGVDWVALHDVLAAARDKGPSRGASTLTMQTAKNLFLWPGRSIFRKGLEIPMALVLGKLWPKRRVIEVYLNVAEWGDGTFGIEAAAERYFHKSARTLDAREGALIAAALPNPMKRDPARPNGLMRRHAAEVMMRAAGDPGALKCL
jgi:monofunctional biosynthetic peptidoglycan transglycosylase